MKIADESNRILRFDDVMKQIWDVDDELSKSHKVTVRLLGLGQYEQPAYAKRDGKKQYDPFFQAGMTGFLSLLNYQERH